MRAKDRSKLNAEIAEGVAAAGLCHYANAAYRLNRVVEIDAKTGMAEGDREADRLLERRGRAPYGIPEKA